MTEYDNTNSGVLFKNDKEGNDKRPDYTGKFTDATGKEWRLAAWLREGQKGKFMSIKASEPQQQNEAPPAGGGTTELDSIPFSPEMR